MDPTEKGMTFIVRITDAGAGGLRGVVERVRTGRKEQVHTVEDIGRVIAAMALGKEETMSLRGKHALVTGGSRGIGRGIALKLAESGAKVAVHYYVNEGAAQETLQRVRKHGADGFLVQADVSRPDDVKRMFGEVRQRFGTLDVFVANARPEAAKFYQTPMEITLEAWDHAMDSQAKAFLVGVREAVPMMGAGGRILAITYAPGGQKGTWQPWVAMGSAKAALESLVRYFAVTLAPRGITVNSVSPGLTDDSVLQSFGDAAVDVARKWHGSGFTPMGRMGTPADIGNVVALLCSPDAGWITGQLIYADGGASLVDTLLPLEIQRG
ncbi:MAG TPA: SDR family oxidoreductase [Methylomirabilota bacterium]|nr:SDR family oxidoreductase [Methylomirabilota bacterium]